MSAQNKANISNSKIPHTMGRGGYSLKIKKMRKDAIEAGQKEAEDPQWKPDREDVYIAGHTPASGKPTEILQHVIDTVVSILITTCLLYLILGTFANNRLLYTITD